MRLALLQELLLLQDQLLLGLPLLELPLHLLLVLPCLARLLLRRRNLLLLLLLLLRQRCHVPAARPSLRSP